MQDQDMQNKLAAMEEERAAVIEEYRSEYRRVMRAYRSQEANRSELPTQAASESRELANLASKAASLARFIAAETKRTGCDTRTFQRAASWGSTAWDWEHTAKLHRKAAN